MALSAPATWRDAGAREAASTAQPNVFPGLEPVVRADGCWFYTQGGRRYFDGTAGSGAIMLGHGHPRVVERVTEQARALCHTGSFIHALVRDRMVAKLTRLAPFATGLALLAVTGAEAVEAALKVARAFTGRRLVIAFGYGYHGKTGGALTVTWRDGYKAFTPLPDGAVVRCPYPLLEGGGPASRPAACLQALGEAIDAAAAAGKPPAAAIIEPVAVTEGVLRAGEDFLGGLIDIVHAAGGLVVFDEIWTGCGRCGTPFYAGRPGLGPDLVIVGKSLGNGFPISAVLGEEAVMSALPAGLHTSTFAGNPIACAAADAVLDVLVETELWHESARVGGELLDRLRALEHDSPIVTAARGEGTVLAFDCVDADGTSSPETAAAFAMSAMHKGVLLGYGGHRGCTIKLAVPAIIAHDDIEHVSGVLAEVAHELRTAP